MNENGNQFLMSVFIFFLGALQNCDEYKTNVFPKAPDFGSTLKEKEYGIFLCLIAEFTYLNSQGLSTS